MGKVAGHATSLNASWHSDGDLRCLYTITCAANIEPVIVKILNLELNLTATLALIPNLNISLTVTFNPEFNLKLN